jgi:hypothetical protein
LAALVANLGLFGVSQDSTFAKTSLGAILLEIVGGLIYVWRTGVLSGKAISVVIQFPENLGKVLLDTDKCFYEVRDQQANIRAKGKIGVAIGISGSWECRIPTPGEYESVALQLTARDRKVWEVRSFYPLSRTENAVIVE